jgi:hypothetical protein
MLNNVMHKPVGILAVLTAAVGGPYAAFETDLGNTVRRALTQMSASATSAADSGSSQQGNTGNNPYDFASHTSGALSQVASSSSSGMTSNGWQGDMSRASQITSPANSTYDPWMQAQVANGQPISTVYGPATIHQLPQGAMPQAAMPQASMAQVSSGMPVGYGGMPGGQWNQGYASPATPPPTMEVRSGPAAAIPGNTDKLWDYTLGTPTLTQMQQQPSAQLGGGTVTDLREVLRFDITPGWLPQRFARVTTVTSEVQMDGLRVPLISGTRSQDIAGSLTYYFDSTQALKRIQLHGMTGDPSQLAGLMVQFYQLRPEQSLGGQLYTARWNNRITSLLQVTPAPVIYAGAEHSKYILFLELNQPSNQYGLSRDALEVLNTAQLTQRWQ